MTTPTVAAELPEALFYASALENCADVDFDHIFVPAGAVIRRLHAQVEALSAARPVAPPCQWAHKACDTPNYCESVQRCTARDSGRAQTAGAATPAAPDTISAAQAVVPADDDLAKELNAARESLQWYMRRCEKLQGVQHRMRDPERTMVCDILANGSLLVPEGQRYALPSAAPQPSPSPAPAQPVQDLQSVNDAVTIDLLNERVAYLEAQLAKVTAPAQPGHEGEPYAYAVYFPDQPCEELVHSLDELLDDLTNREHTIVELYDRAARAAPQPATADAVDAERYRWLRRWKGQEHEPPFTVRHEIDGTLWGGDLDAAIDAALAAQREVKP